MQDELSIEKARVAILVEERNELLRKVFELEEQVRRLTQRAADLPLGARKIKVLRKRQTANANR